MSKVLTKADVVKALADKIEVSQKQANACVGALFDVITDELVAGNKINFTGFGKFEVVTRAAREGRNPGTGEKIQIPEVKAPVFRAGKTFKSAVN